LENHNQAEHQIDRIDQLCADIDDALAVVRDMLSRNGIPRPIATPAVSAISHTDFAPKTNGSPQAAAS